MTHGELDGLIQLVASGDRTAFAALFRQAAPKVKGYLLRLGTAPPLAEELAQEVMLTIWHKAAQFDPSRSSAMTWIFVIARNRRIDSLRRERSTVTYGITAPDSADDAPSADEALAGAEAEARMRAAIGTLPPEQQDVVRRSFFADEPHSAIAEALGLPLGTVKSRLRLAFARLRGQMEDLR